MDVAHLTALAGKFLVFDGPDGSGKSTQLKRFVAACEHAGLTVRQTREPGGTDVGEKIRAILLDRASDMTLMCEMLLYMASRTQLVETIIRPALSAHELVIADRFVSSTYAYQGHAGGLAHGAIHAVAQVATLGVEPDLVVIFDVDAETAARRTKGVEKKGRRSTPAGSSLFDDRIEQRGDEYQRRVRLGFLAQAAADPNRFLVIDAGAEEEVVWERLIGGLGEKLGLG